MSWIAIVFWVITNIPNFIGIIREILELINSIPRGERVALRDRIATAIHSGDKMQVKEALKAVHTTCSGVGCVSQPIGE